MLSKDILARLLATENLTVIHQKVNTASFNVKDRVLTLPIWDNMEEYTYDHLVGHEVGHALYTPEDGWHDAVSSRGRQFKSYLNVIEDARIEKLVQRKYPGLRREFIKSYRKMLKDGFFGDDIDGINRMGLIDRINTYFKCGVSAGIKLSPVEMNWVREIDQVETWEQVVDIAERMYDKALAQAEEEKQQMLAVKSEQDGEEEAEDMEMDSGFDNDNDDIEEDGGNDGSNPFDELESEDKEPDVSSKTDNSLRSSINQEYDKSSVSEINNIIANPLDTDWFIVSYKSVLEKTQNMKNIIRRDLYNSSINLEKTANTLYTKFMANNKKTINYLVKEFEMKKSATNYSRSYISKTGVIDPVKMNTYRYNDDIFRKVNITPDGKNHGMIMYLDWSGSMGKDIFNTVEQTLNLVHFCRQVNIPFRLYAFTDHWSEDSYFEDGYEIYKEENERRASYAEYQEKQEHLSVFPDNNFRLVEFMSNKMNKQQFARMNKVLLCLAHHVSILEHPFKLHGTPLDQSILLAGSVYRLFQKVNKVDIVNTIFLTDGNSHPFNVNYRVLDQDNKYLRSVKKSASDVSPNRWNYNEKLAYIINNFNKLRYKLMPDQTTKTLLKMYKEETGSTVIGYRIMPSNRYSFERDLISLGGKLNSIEMDELYKNLRKNKYMNVTGVGYDKFFCLKGGKDLETANGEFTVAEDAKKGDISKAFKIANRKKLVSRSLLNEFVSEIA